MLCDLNTQPAENQISDKRTYMVSEIANILGISASSAYSLVKENVFNSVRIGSTIRISKKSFDEWLDSNNL